MSDLDALVRAVCDRPNDDTPRLIVADWLDDHDDSRRAAFIRLHVAYARETRRTYRKRMERQIKDSLRGVVTLRSQQWVADILDGEGMGLSVDGWGYSVVPVNHCARVHRGFVSSVTTEARWLVENGGRLLAANPIQSVELFGTNMRLEIDPPGSDYGWQVYVYDGASLGSERDDYTHFFGGLETRDVMVATVIEYACEWALIA